MPHGSAIVWPVTDERSGTRLVLVGEAAADVLDRVRDKLDAGASPFERISETRSVARIPRTALGKVDAAAMQSLIGE